MEGSDEDQLTRLLLDVLEKLPGACGRPVSEMFDVSYAVTQSDMALDFIASYADEVARGYISADDVATWICNYILECLDETSGDGPDDEGEQLERLIACLDAKLGELK